MSAETRIQDEGLDFIEAGEKEDGTEVLFFGMEFLYCGLIGIWAVLGLWFSASLLVIFMS
jgi:hypothetical protein